MNEISLLTRRSIKLIIAFTAMLISSCSEQERPKQIPTATGKFSIIPQPLSVQPLTGKFILSSDTRILARDDASHRVAILLNEDLKEYSGINLEITDTPDLPDSIILTTVEDRTNPEGYVIRVEPDYIHIIGSERGMFYAVQSLARLIPTEFTGAAAIPATEIYDSPRFPYRGMHLDVARHFMPVDFVKRYIRLLSQYKFNYFHWHLTDDQGWRIEIKKYPRLTEIGSKRPETVLGKNYQPYRGDRIPVEGFYTQDEIREIVEYARRYYITIIPEIDMPGHSSSALAANPNLGCKSDSPYRVKTTWGGFPDILCPSEETFQFVGDVLDEVIDLFPDSPYIHIGADEVVYDQWASSDVVKEVMRTNGLQSQSQVYSWFLKKVESQINARGKKMIGWDEMLDAPDPPNATVMSWQGLAPGIKAANSGREVIMAPNSHAYFDRPQSESPLEPLALGKPLSLREVYSFDPVPPEIAYQNRGFVLGAQGCLWTEFIKRPKDVEYMAFPRAIALAEVLWSPQSSRNFVDFQARLRNELVRLDRQKVNYRKIVPMLPPGQDPKAKAINPVSQRRDDRTKQSNRTGGK